MLLPSGRKINPSTPIYFGSNFTWGEATKKCTRPLGDLIIQGRIYATATDIEQNIIATAKRLDGYRAMLDNRPLHVTSWYRPKHVNQSVGGSRYSRHQYGDAVDLISYYFKPGEIFQRLNGIHHLGGLSAYPGFVHIDWRGNRARW